MQSSRFSSKALLRQPGGFEGFGPGQVSVSTKDPAVSDRPCGRPLNVGLHVGVPHASLRSLHADDGLAAKINGGASCHQHPPGAQLRHLPATRRDAKDRLGTRKRLRDDAESRCSPQSLPRCSPHLGIRPDLSPAPAVSLDGMPLSMRSRTAAFRPKRLLRQPGGFEGFEIDRLTLRSLSTADQGLLDLGEGRAGAELTQVG